MLEFPSYCGSQVCQHPRCWHLSRVTKRQLNQLNIFARNDCDHFPLKTSLKKNLSGSKKKKSRKHKRPATDYLPSLKVVDVRADDYKDDEINFKELPEANLMPPPRPCNSPLFLSPRPPSSLSSGEHPGSIAPVNSPHEDLSEELEQQPAIDTCDLRTRLELYQGACPRVELSLATELPSKPKKTLVWQPSIKYLEKKGNEYYLPTKSSSSLKGSAPSKESPQLSITEISEELAASRTTQSSGNSSKASFKRYNMRGKKVNSYVFRTGSSVTARSAQALHFPRVQQQPHERPTNHPPIDSASIQLDHLRQLSTDELVAVLRRAVDTRVMTFRQTRVLLQQIQHDRREMARNNTREELSGQVSPLSLRDINDSDGLEPTKSYLLKKPHHSLQSSSYKLDTNPSRLQHGLLPALNPIYTCFKKHGADSATNLQKIKPSVNRIKKKDTGEVISRSTPALLPVEQLADAAVSQTVTGLVTREEDEKDAVAAPQVVPDHPRPDAGTAVSSPRASRSLMFTTDDDEEFFPELKSVSDATTTMMVIGSELKSKETGFISSNSSHRRVRSSHERLLSSRPSSTTTTTTTAVPLQRRSSSMTIIIPHLSTSSSGLASPDPPPPSPSASKKSIPPFP